VATVVIGLSLGMLLFLLASGLTLIFGMLRTINFAHGAFYMLGAYLSYQVVSWTDSFWICLVAAPLIVGIIGALVEIVTLRPIYGRDPVFQVLLTFGIVLLVYEFTRTLWGLDYRSVSAPVSLSQVVSFGDFHISAYRLFVIGFGVLVSALLFLLLECTVLGVVIRAASANSAMVECLGTDVSKVRTVVFAIGTGLAGLGGSIAAPILPITLDMGFHILIDCFMVVVIGGLGSIRGAVVGALIIGLSRAFGERYAPEWIDVVTFSVFVLVLLTRPQGIFGVRGREA
jgi:branched-chain amino acid transport system permease protein